MMRKRLSLLLLLGLLFTLTTLAQSVRVEAHLDSTHILVGEQVRLHVKVTTAPNSNVNFPNFEKGYLTEGVEMLQASKVDTISAQPHLQLSRSYLITSFDSATYTIPQIEVEINNNKHLSPNEIKLNVGNIEVDLAHPEDIRPFREPVVGNFEWTFSIFGWCLFMWGLLLLLGYLLALLSRQRPMVRRIKVTPPTPPHQVAITAIEALRTEQPTAQEEQKEYFIRLTNVLRNYIEERFGFNAMEMTTTEIIAHLRQANDQVALNELREVLNTADLVKFARYEASMVESDWSLLQAANYIQTTKLENSTENQPKEQWVEVGDTRQRSIRKMLKAATIIVAITLFGVFNYIGYLLWLNFL